MDRRDFLRTSIFASGAFMVPSFLKGMESLVLENTNGYKYLVIVQLSGGNDGLNTVIPHRNDIYHQLRPSIRREHVLELDEDLGFNSKCEGLHRLYQNGELLVINNVGYPNPNRSHFRSTDIWHSGSGSNEYLHTGWVGRYLDANCQSAYQAIEHNNELSLILKGRNLKGIAMTDPQQLFSITKEPYFSRINEQTEHMMLDEDNQGYLYKTLIETYNSAAYIFENSSVATSSTEFPNNAFGKNLKGITNLINSGLNSRVFYTSLGGFDTHANQVGSQENLLKTYSESMEAIVKELKRTGRFKDTLIMTFSEFGRRVKENGSKGTDHGAANNVFVISGGLKTAGIYNPGPNLSNLDDNGDILFEIDFRSVYATILDKWLNVNDQRILNKNFSKLSFL